MRIVIDLQGALSLGNRKRGIGRYTSSLAQAIARRARNHEIVLALNGRFPDAIDEIQSTFDGMVEPCNFRVWHPPLYSDRSSPGSRRAREKLYEAFLASLQPDVVHVSSLFEGLDDAAVTSIGSFVRQPTAVTLYDLIPLINARSYLEQDRTRSWYMRKIESLRRANMWLAISESSRQEGIDHLGLAEDRCINISTAAYDHFKPARPTAQREQELRDRYGLNQPFVMYTGGIDVRKNLDGLVRAFGLLPPELAVRHQLAIVCSARPEDRKALLELAKKSGLDGGKLVVTGFVPEQDLVDLYNLCSLFVFPSWHEGFGLPALEAMHCGAVVIAANTSSLPEVLGREDALFAPRNDEAMAMKMVQGLTDEGFRSVLKEHGLTQAQKFSWDESARRAIEGLEALHRSSSCTPCKPEARHSRPRLAYLSPLPPQPSGIADYSAELLPALAQHYEIDLVTGLSATTDPGLAASFPLRSLEWFRRNSNLFDRVLYHFGNSEFHEHMFPLLEEIPGVVVLHDFYLSGVQAFREFGAGQPHAWARALYDSHGYPAVIQRFRTNDVADMIYKFPCSLDILRYAQGVIVHSPHSIDLARNWYGSIANNLEMVPLLRAPAARDPRERQRARDELGLKPDDFLVCSFGLLGPTKLVHRVLQAWQASPLARDPRCKLRFVGENPSDEYGTELLRQIAQGGREEDVEITGWASSETYRRYLAAADLAVQLRAKSRGETSAAVLDTMSRGIPTIVNAHGSMAFLPHDAVLMLEDDFDDAQLIEALENQWRDPAGRLALGARARTIVETLHAPAACAKLYAEVIERFVQRANAGRTGLIRAIGAEDPLAQSADGHHEALELASAIAESLPLPMSQRQLFIDVSNLAQSGIQTQQTLESLIRESLDANLEGYRIEPVRTSESGEPGYCYARRFALALRNLPVEALADEPIDFRAGDLFAVLSVSPDSAAEHAEYYRKLRHSGVRVRFFQIATAPAFTAHEGPDDAKVHLLRLNSTTTPDGRSDEQATRAFLRSLIDVDTFSRSGHS